MTPSNRFLALALLFVTGLAAHAQVAFTLTGTANSSAHGYTSTQAYTFTFTTGSSFTINGNSTFSTQLAEWNEATAADDQLFHALSGSGLTGSFVSPGAPQSFIQIATNAGAVMELFAGTNNYTGPIGLTTPLGTAIGQVYGSFLTFSTDPGFSNLNTPTDPVTYFSPYFGTYGLSSGVFEIKGISNTTLMSFTPTSLAIASAIPEPSTYAALAGLGALVLVALRRRRTV